MKPLQWLARTSTPDGSDMALTLRDTEYVILVGGKPLMSSRMHGSEEALATLACADARLRKHPRVLVGGLGMGFTLRAALDLLPADGAVTVAELVPAVVEWNRGALADLAGRPLADPRARVHVGDVAEVIGAARGLDAILLDVDNSPHALTRPSNQGLYGEAGLAASARALRPGGCVAIWSAVQAPEVMGRMRRAGLAPEAHAARAVGRSGGVHTIYVGRTDGSRALPRK